MNRRDVLIGLAGVALVPSMAMAGSPELRIIETATGKEVRWKSMLDAASKSDAIFVGEQHDDPETHRIELEILQDLHDRVGQRLILSMEMFERDQHVVLDPHLAGGLTEDDLGKKTKLWGNYTTDYAPMVRFAAKNLIPVVAANCPNAIIRKVGQGGIDALAKLPESERRYAAKTII
ncbi:MAG: ChaN family lipoprotein, partial [Armatimonadaceae bacterium]